MYLNANNVFDIQEDALDKQSSQLVANNTQTSNETLIFEERKKAEKMATKYQGSFFHVFCYD